MQNATMKACKIGMEARDRFSELPDAIVNHILSLVPTVDAVRMSVLSKRWQNVWYSLAALEILAPDYDSDIESDHTIEKLKEKHYRFVSNCLKLRKMDMITKFKLSTEQSRKHIDGWLKLIAQSRIKELDLSVLRHFKYELPADVFRTRSLTHLTLNNVCLEDSIFPISLPCLMPLSLKVVRLKDEILSDILSGCSALEKLRLNRCRNLFAPRVSSSSLKFLDFINSGETFQVEAMNLESLKLAGFRGYMRPIFNHQACGRIRNLSFSFVALDEEWLEDIIRKLPCLECLTIDRCHLKHVKIFSEQLRVFTLVEISVFDFKPEITIDAPNLVHFSYEGGSVSDFSANVPNLQGARVAFIGPECQHDANWYINLIYFLSGLECCKTMCLHVDSEKSLILPYKVRKVIKAPLPVLKHLKVRIHPIGRPLFRTSDLNDSLLWIMPSLETVSVTKKK